MRMPDIFVLHFRTIVLNFEFFVLDFGIFVLNYTHNTSVVDLKVPVTISRLLTKQNQFVGA